MDAHPVEVEVSIVRGLPAFTIVGLPDPSIQEARERVRSAVQASSEEWPLSRVTVNLSPAHLRKAGSNFDLAMALGILCAAGRVPQGRLRELCVVGELSLDGGVRRVRGVLPSALSAARTGKRAVVVPAPNAPEAALVDGLEVLPARRLTEVVRFLRREATLEPYEGSTGPVPRAEDDETDLSDVRGQTNAKRALEVAAAGGHNLLMMGPPGGGKTMLARRLPAILPDLHTAEAFEVTRLYSVAGLLADDGGLVRRRPFRAPHHTVSTSGLVGGGSGLPQPGEISLAHRGVLFLDELSEFRRDAIQALRGPLEDGAITIVRSKWSVTYPSRFQLVAASNECPCGGFGDPLKECTCLPGAMAGFRERLSGPVLDRIDVRIKVDRPTRFELFHAPEGERSDAARDRVLRAREVQRERLAAFGVPCNAEIPSRLLEEVCRPTSDARAMLENAVDGSALSARGVHRAMRVARTVADLRGVDRVTEDEILDALSLQRVEGIA